MSKVIRTAGQPAFFSSGHVDKDQLLFTVNHGVDLADALASASDLLSMIEEPIFDAGMGHTPLDGNGAWCVLHVLRSAKAVIDSLVLAAEEANGSVSHEAHLVAEEVRHG